MTAVSPYLKLPLRTEAEIREKRATQSKCERCEEEDISPVVEAFELSGQIVCEDCAEEVFQENSQFGVVA